MNDMTTIGGTIFASLVALSLAVPKILNQIKGERIDSSVLDRIERHEKRMDNMDKLIHSQQIRLTRLQVLVIQLLGIIKSNHIEIPQDIQDEVDILLSTEHEHEKENKP